MRQIVYLFILLAMICVSCSTTKSLSEGDVLYTGSRIQLKRVDYNDDWKIEQSAKKLSTLYWELWDTPNSAIMGLPRFQGIPTRLWIYNLFYTEKKRGFSRWMQRNFGEEPITINDVSPGLKVQKGINIYENFGHFGSTGNYYLKYNKKKNKAYIRYSFLIPKAYTYRNIAFEKDPTKYSINNSFMNYQSKSILNPDDEFNLDILKKEKNEIWTHLKNDGYYFIKEDDIKIDADTTVGYKQIDLIVSIDDSLSDPVYRRQIIDDVELSIDQIKQNSESDKYYYWDYGRVRKKMMNHIIRVSEGDYYSLQKNKESVRNLTELGIFSNPQIKYINKGEDSLNLISQVKLNSIDASTVGFNIRGNYKTAGYIGPSVGLTFGQLNVFSGAENLNVEADVYYDFPIGAFKERISNSSGFSLRSMLSAPLIKTPFKFIRTTYALPKQHISFNFEFNDRKDYFTMVGWNTSYGFTWKSTPNITHRLDLVNATYSDIINSTPRFDTLVAENPLLRTSLVDQFIIGSNYTFIYDNRSTEDKRLGLFFEGKVDLSGNTANLLNSVFTRRENGEKKLLGVKFAQFVQFQYDFRAYWRLGTYNHLVFRNIAGIGLHYGNSSQMPYIKQFFIGGTNSLRPITARSVGPGRYLEFDRGEVNQVGDLKLEWNLEYRFRLFWKLNGAIWSDAGNIWLLKEDPNRPGSGVRWGKIFEDSYLTAGVGVRLDVKFITLRFDYGAVIYAPIFPNGLKWLWENKLPWFPVVGFGYPF